MSLTLVVDPAVVQDYPGLAATLGISAFQPVNGPTTSYGHNVPAAGYFVVQNCSGALTFTDGPLTPAQVAAIPACTADANAATLRSRALTALTNSATFLALPDPTAANNTYLGLSNPSSAQTTAQVKALTRQSNAYTAQMVALTREMDAVIRLLLNQTDSISDS